MRHLTAFDFVNDQIHVIVEIDPGKPGVYFTAKNQAEVEAIIVGWRRTGWSVPCKDDSVKPVWRFQPDKVRELPYI